MTTVEEIEETVSKINAIIVSKSDKIQTLKLFIDEIKKAKDNNQSFDDEDIKLATEKLHQLEQDISKYETLGSTWIKLVGDLNKKINQRYTIFEKFDPLLKEDDFLDLRTNCVNKQRELQTMLNNATAKVKKNIDRIDRIDRIDTELQQHQHHNQ